MQDGNIFKGVHNTACQYKQRAHVKWCTKPFLLQFREADYWHGVSIRFSNLVSSSTQHAFQQAIPTAQILCFSMNPWDFELQRQLKIWVTSF